MNPNVDVLVDFGLEAKIKSFLAKKFNAHAMDQTLHPHGRISYGGLKASTDISRKIAKVDLSRLPVKALSSMVYADDMTMDSWNMKSHLDLDMLA